MRGRLFQSAGEAPRLRSHSELVSEPAQGPASCSNPHLPRPSSAPATPSSCPCAASSHRASALPGPSWLCSHSPCCLCLLQGPLPRRLCAGPRAPSACEMRPWQVGSGGNSAPDSQWGEALNHSALGTPPGSDSDSAGRAPRPVPVAKVRDGGPCLPRSPTSVSPAPSRPSSASAASPAASPLLVDPSPPWGGGFPPVPSVSPQALPASALVPVAQ